ncbi:MAG: YgaP family membrane protein [Microbacter sp.]
MKKNVGAVDKVIRVIIAALLVILYFANVIHGTLGIILLIVAAVLLITAFTGFCGLYVLFGISTCKKEKKN